MQSQRVSSVCNIVVLCFVRNVNLLKYIRKYENCFLKLHELFLQFLSEMACFNDLLLFGKISKKFIQNSGTKLKYYYCVRCDHPHENQL